jgi:hypothetical protein
LSDIPIRTAKSKGVETSHPDSGREGIVVGLDTNTDDGTLVPTGAGFFSSKLDVTTVALVALKQVNLVGSVFEFVLGLDTDFSDRETVREVNEECHESLEEIHFHGPSISDGLEVVADAELNRGSDVTGSGVFKVDAGSGGNICGNHSDCDLLVADAISIVVSIVDFAGEISFAGGEITCTH